MKSHTLQLILACLWCWANLIPLRVQAIPLWVFAGGGSSPAPAGYLVEENCEGTGTPSGWTNTGTLNWDYTTTALQGSQSLTNSATFTTTYYAYSGQTTVYAYCLLRRRNQGASADQPVFEIRSDSTVLAGLYDNYSSTNTRWKLHAGGSLSSQSGSWQAQTPTVGTYHVWLTFVSGGTCELAMSTSGTKPSTDGSTNLGDVFLTKTGASATATRVRCYAGLSGDWIWDRILVSTSPIGDNP